MSLGRAFFSLPEGERGKQAFLLIEVHPFIRGMVWRQVTSADVTNVCPDTSSSSLRLFQEEKLDFRGLMETRGPHLSRTFGTRSMLAIKRCTEHRIISKYRYTPPLHITAIQPATWSESLTLAGELATSLSVMTRPIILETSGAPLALRGPYEYNGEATRIRRISFCKKDLRRTHRPMTMIYKSG